MQKIYGLLAVYYHTAMLCVVQFCGGMLETAGRAFHHCEAVQSDEEHDNIKHKFDSIRGKKGGLHSEYCQYLKTTR